MQHHSSLCKQHGHKGKSRQVTNRVGINSCSGQPQQSTKVHPHACINAAVTARPRRHHWKLAASATDATDETREELQWLGSLKQAPQDRAGEVRQLLNNANDWRTVVHLATDLGRELSRQIGMSYDMLLLLADMVNSPSGKIEPLSRYPKQLLAPGEQLPAAQELYPAVAAVLTAVATRPTWLAGPRLLPFLSALGTLNTAGYIPDLSQHRTLVLELAQVGQAVAEQMRVQESVQLVHVFVNQLDFTPKTEEWVQKIFGHMLGKLHYLDAASTSNLVLACDKLGPKLCVPSPYWMRELLDAPIPLLLQLQPAALCALASLVSSHAPPLKDAKGRRSLFMESWASTFHTAWTAQLRTFHLHHVLSLLKNFQTLGVVLTDDQLQRACYHVLRRLQAGEERGTKLQSEVCQMLLAVKGALAEREQADSAADMARGGYGQGRYGENEGWNGSYGGEYGRREQGRNRRGEEERGEGSVWLEPWLREWVEESVVVVGEDATCAARLLIALSSVPSCETVGKDMMSDLLDTIEPGLDYMKPTLLLALPAALERLDYTPSVGWLASFFDASRPTLDRASSSQLRLLCKALTLWGQPAPEDFVASLGLAVKKQVSTSGKIHENMAEGLLAAGCDPITVMNDYYPDTSTLPTSVALHLIKSCVADPDTCNLEVIRLLLMVCQPALPRLSPQQLTSLLVSLAKASVALDDFHLPEGWLDSFAEALALSSGELRHAHTTAIVWALNMLEVPLDRRLLQHLAGKIA